MKLYSLQNIFKFEGKLANVKKRQICISDIKGEYGVVKDIKSSTG